MKARAFVLIPLAGLLPGGVACKRTLTEQTTIAPAAAPAADGLLVLPGDYSERTTVADLENRFGKVNVRKETTPEPRVVLFPDDPARRAYVTFYERERFEHLARIFVSEPGSLWRGKHGTHIGMTFAKVRALNGKPFSYVAFAGQNSLLVRDSWSPALDDDEGKPGAFDVTEGDHLYFEIEFGPRDPADAEAIFSADEPVSSDDPRVRSLGERIIVTGLGAGSSLDDEWE